MSVSCTTMAVLYKDNKGRHNTLYTNVAFAKDRDKDGETVVLFDNSAWTNDAYQQQFEDLLRKTYKDIHAFLKIYTKTTAREEFK